jgi:hypothetical protein
MNCGSIGDGWLTVEEAAGTSPAAGDVLIPAIPGKGALSNTTISHQHRLKLAPREWSVAKSPFSVVFGGKSTNANCPQASDAAAAIEQYRFRPYAAQMVLTVGLAVSLLGRRAKVHRHPCSSLLSLWGGHMRMGSMILRSALTALAASTTMAADEQADRVPASGVRV